MTLRLAVTYLAIATSAGACTGQVGDSAGSDGTGAPTGNGNAPGGIGVASATGRAGSATVGQSPLRRLGKIELK